MSIDLTEFVVETALRLGAEEAECDITNGSNISLTRREGKVEEAKQATSRGLSLSVMVEGRYVSCSTSDLRREALEDFIRKAVKAASYLEEDRDRALAPIEDAETNRAGEFLDTVDPLRATLHPDARDLYLQELEDLSRSLYQPDVISGSVFYQDAVQALYRTNSNGISLEEAATWFVAGGELSLRDGDKMPEGYAHFATTHMEDLPPTADIAQAIHDNTRDQVGSKALPSGKYPMLLRRDQAARLLGMLLGPMSGAALHQQQSCFSDALGSIIGSRHLTLLSDPTLKRAFGSCIWDNDNRAAQPRTLVHEGVLREYNIDLYHSRKLGVKPTGGIHNLVVPPGDRTDADILLGLPKCIVVTGFLGGNSNPTSGDFSLGIVGTYYENGEKVGAVSEMNVSGNLTTVFKQLIEVASDPWTYGSTRSPSLLFDDITFSGK